jgi:hypothetical protein
LVALLVMPCFLVAKYGNEGFERIRPDERETVAALYRIAPKGSALVSITPNLPWRYSSLTDYDYKPRTLDEFALDKLDVIVQLISGNDNGGYLIVTTGQLAYASQVYGLPASWGADVDRALVRSGRFILVYRNSGGAVYRFVPRPQAEKRAQDRKLRPGRVPAPPRTGHRDPALVRTGTGVPADAGPVGTAR